MKVIDLLNKIANGKIDRNDKYHFSYNDYCTINEFFARYILDEENLNLEIIEIPEEKKIPEKLYNREDYATQNACIDDIIRQFNNLIDYLKSKGE